jgi:hypothetical protein
MPGGRGWPNTGGGGGGTDDGYTSYPLINGNGGSGIVLVAYPQ